MVSQQDSHQAPPTWTYMHQMQDLVSLFVEICCILEKSSSEERLKASSLLTA